MLRLIQERPENKFYNNIKKKNTHDNFREFHFYSNNCFNYLHFKDNLRKARPPQRTEKTFKNFLRNIHRTIQKKSLKTLFFVPINFII